MEGRARALITRLSPRSLACCRSRALQLLPRASYPGDKIQARPPSPIFPEAATTSPPLPALSAAGRSPCRRRRMPAGGRSPRPRQGAEIAPTFAWWAELAFKRRKRSPSASPKVGAGSFGRRLSFWVFEHPGSCCGLSGDCLIGWIGSCQLPLLTLAWTWYSWGSGFARHADPQCSRSRVNAAVV